MDKLKEYEEFYGNISFSILFIDPENKFDLKSYLGYCPGKNILYIDLSEVKNEDYKSIGSELAANKYDGVMFDNIDEIPRIKDREDWRFLVKYALKKEEIPLVYPLKGEIKFHDLITAVRCKNLPDYIDTRIINGIILNLKP